MAAWTRILRNAAATLLAAWMAAPAWAEPNPAGEPARVTIHYHRFDGDYEGLGVWTWDQLAGRQPQQQEIFPVGEDDFGKVLTFSPGDYGPADKPAAVGIIPRLGGSWDRKDGGDRFWQPSMGAEVWLIGGDGNLYTEKPDVSPKLRDALLDGPRTVTLAFTHAENVDRIAAPSVKLLRGDAEVALSSVTAVEPKGNRATRFALMAKEDLGVRDELKVSVEGFPSAVRVTPGSMLLDPALFSTDAEMGAVYAPAATTFRVFSPLARGAEIVLYDAARGDAGRTVVPMASAGRGVWEARVDGDLLGRHYMVKVDADGPAANREVVDINAKCTTGRDGRGRIVDPRRLDPPGFRQTPRPANIQAPTDAVIWEVSLRDFTMDASSGVPEGRRGKFSGAAMRGMRLPGTELKTGIDYLAELGVTHVQILPIQDFDNREESGEYNWGYMTSFFNSPDGWFASQIESDARIREFKEFVQACHGAGIRVVMDVVYNHTAPNATFESIAPGYYHRMKADGSYWNGSGTGNEFRSEAPMARKFIVDSCRYWADEYRIDGFRFDLMGLVDVETMKQVRDAVRAIDPTLLVYGEPWAAGGSGIKQVTDKGVAAAGGLGAFNDHFRNAIKGAPDGPEPGFVMHGQGRDGMKRGIEGAINDWARHPADAIQYMTCHDNLSLWDKIMLSAPNATAQERLRMNQLGHGILAVSQGVMFLHAGSEFGYSKGGEHNSYNKPDSVNSIKWTNLVVNGELQAFVRDAIRMRRAHPVFRLATREEVAKRLKFRDDLCPNLQCIAWTLDGSGVAGEAWKEALVLVNGSVQPATFALPEGAPWRAHLHNGAWTPAMRGEMAGTVSIDARTMLVLAR